jgi:CRISPR-associated endonuclease Csn1
MLKKIADAADDQRDRLIEKMPEPWQNFDRNELGALLRNLTVSFRTDHGSTGIDPTTGRARSTGALHNDTAYFPTSEPDKDGISDVVSREAISSFETIEDIDAICDPGLRELLKGFVVSRLAQGQKVKDVCAEFINETRIRKAKTKKRLKIIPIRDRTERVYKAYKGDSNDYMEVWRLPNGNWTGRIVSTFDANQIRSLQRIRPHPAAKLIAKLHNDDTVRLTDDKDEDRTLRIVKMSGQKVTMADHFESGSLKGRDSDKCDPFKYLERSVSVLRSM